MSNQTDYLEVCAPEGPTMIARVEDKEILDGIVASLYEHGAALIGQMLPCSDEVALIAIVPMSPDVRAHLERAEKMAAALGPIAQTIGATPVKQDMQEKR